MEKQQVLVLLSVVAALVGALPVPDDDRPISFSTTTATPLLDSADQKLVHDHRNITSVCDSMVPAHGNAEPSKMEAPYTVTVSTHTLAPQGELTVTVAGKDNETFKGIYMQARGVDQKPVGQFQHSDDPHVLLSTCHEGNNNAALYIRNESISSFSFHWRAPEEQTTVTFYTTIVYNYATFWTMLKSEPVTVTK